MKKIQYIVTITFAAILAVLCFCSLFTDSDGFSPFENRFLSQRPDFSVKDFFAGDFSDEYETYLLDNFILRDMSIIGYQSYSNLLYLDAFIDNETVLASVDIDSFVSAQGLEGIKTVQNIQDPQSESNGHVVRQNPHEPMTDPNNQVYDTAAQEQGPQDGMGYESGGTSSDELQSDGQQQSSDGMEPENDDDGTGDSKVNNSLIIAGDRVMMPTGSSGKLELHGEIMSELARLMPQLNVYSITGPTSAAFYASEKYSTGVYDQSRAEKIISRSAEGVTVVKVYDKLMEHRDEEIYFRSDVHWSALGAYHAYAAFCESAGMEAADIENDYIKDSYKPFLGGLYSQIYNLPQAARLKDNPEQLDYYIPKLGHQVILYTMGDRNRPRIVDSIINTDFDTMGAYKYACFAWGDQHLAQINTDNPNGRKVMVLKDSYGSALIPFLAHNYSVVYVIDPKGFNNEGCLEFDAKTLILEEEIDDVIFCFSIYGSAREIIRDSLTNLLLK